MGSGLKDDLSARVQYQRHRQVPEWKNGEFLYHFRKENGCNNAIVELSSDPMNEAAEEKPVYETAFSQENPQKLFLRMF